MELQFSKRKLKPEIEREIKDGFFEIKKKFQRESSDVRSDDNDDPSS